MLFDNKQFPSCFEKCVCSSHLLEVQKYCDDMIQDEGFYLTIWSCSRQSQIMSWRERLRWIWKIFRTGNPWADSVVISNEQAKHITKYINKHLPKE